MTIDVATSASSYQVLVGQDLSAEFAHTVANYHRVALIYPASLRALAQRIGQLVSGAVAFIEVPESEQAKTVSVLAGCWDQLAEAGFTRSDLIVGLGGGTTTDLAGFVAATWLRGIDYLALPTSVLAMVDAAVGGKTGINIPAGKNLAGAFYEPIQVLCDLSLLSELPAVEVNAGMAEVVKCGFIKDPEILRLVADYPAEAKDVASEICAELVRRAIQVKADVVAKDLHEATSTAGRVGREALNYGHTLGHAIEARENFRMRHGEAISIGMAWMARVSQRLLGLDPSVVEQHQELLGTFDLPLSYDASAYDELRQLMNLDKKTRGSSLRLIGLAQVGEVALLESPDEDVLREAYFAL